jgi:hypothetical protein
MTEQVDRKQDWLRGDWFQTFTGRKFYPADVRPDDIAIEDIAHALANSCRFAGHCDKFYSVAQHSVLVSLMVPAEDALWGLLHDSEEAYFLDMPRPLKYLPELTEYRELATAGRRVILNRFGLSQFEPDSVKAADRKLLLRERMDLFDTVLGTLPAGEIPTFRVVPWTPQLAERNFLARFKDLNGIEREHYALQEAA